MEYFLESRDLVRLANARKEEYAAADPFPHVVIDDFLSPAQVNEILADFPPSDASFWTNHHHPTTIEQDTTPEMLAEMQLPP